MMKRNPSDLTALPPCQIIGLGAGGHAKVILEILQLLGGYSVVGMLDPDRTRWGTSVLGVRVLGGDDLLPRMHDDGVTAAFIGIGSIGSTAHRKQIFELVRSHGFELVNVVHPRAYIAPSAEAKEGLVIMADAIVNTQACIGANVIINSGAIVEHDCVIEDHVHVASGSRLAGGVRVCEGAHVGLGACVRQQLTIGRNAVVGAGAVVVDDVPDETVVAGVPARHLRRTAE